MQQDADRQDEVPPAPVPAPDAGVPPAPERRPTRTGRNLPAAIAVGVLLGGLALLTLFTVKATFLLYVGIIVGLALWELSHALGTRGIHVPLVPIAAGGIAMVTLAYWTQTKWALAALAVSGIAVFAWRLPGGADGYVRDVTAGMFTLLYLPLAAVFVALMLVEPDGSRRALIFIVLTVCSDTGGYLAGILLGKHPMAPAISPKKTWEGLAGSIVLCLAAGAIMVPDLLDGQLWQGLVVGLAAVGAATLGDLVESMIKRDLGIKDMGHLLPGHGGIMERLDSLLIMAPIIWLLLALFVPNGHAT
ncbi:MAG TPA: phosphatidate cytidylyltransferase [Streptosporangiaceae bacterium]